MFISQNVVLVAGTLLCSGVLSVDLTCSISKVNVVRKWPPADPRTIQSEKTGEYDVRINPHLAKDAQYKNSLYDAVSAAEKKYKKKAKGTCFFQIANILYRVRKSSDEYYPQQVDYKAIIKAVREGKEVYEAPMNDLPLSIVKRPKVCETQHDFVLVILSCPHCYTERKKFRTKYLNPSLWKNVKLAHVFVMGKPARKSTQTFYFIQLIVKNIENYPKGMDRDAIYSEMLFEAGKYQDMLIGDFEHNMFADTWSYVLFLRWASVFCNTKVPLFGLMSSKYVLIPDKFSAWLKSYSKSKMLRLYGGHSMNRRKVYRNIRNKWGVSWHEFSLGNYPTYIHRKFIFLGHDLVQDSAIMTAWTNHFRYMEMYIGIVHHKMKVPSTEIMGIYSRLHSVKAARHAKVGDMKLADKYINWTTGKAK